MTPANKETGCQAGSGMSAGERRFHVQSATAEPLLQRLDGVQKSGNGWRARCPACGGKSRKVSVAEVEARVLVHCFGGCQAIEVLQAVGLSWSDVMPPRHWPESPDERRKVRRAMQQANWAAALEILSMEACVVQAAARQIERWRVLSKADDTRLAEAVQRIQGASVVLNVR